MGKKTKQRQKAKDDSSPATERKGEDSPSEESTATPEKRPNQHENWRCRRGEFAKSFASP
jgi:hypothetical protein